MKQKIEEKQQLIKLKEFIKESTMFSEPYEYEFIVKEPIIKNNQYKKHVKKLGIFPSYKK